MGDQGMSLAEQIRSRVVYYAEHNLGFGETEGNNAGRFIRAIGGKDGDEWCGVFAGYCLRKAFAAEMVALPFELSKGAKRLVKNVGDFVLVTSEAEALAGAKFTDPTHAKPGDLVCWHRTLIPWRGHVGIVQHVYPNGTIDSIEGNVGGKVRLKHHDVRKERLYAFAGIR